MAMVFLAVSIVGSWRKARMDRLCGLGRFLHCTSHTRVFLRWHRDRGRCFPYARCAIPSHVKIIAKQYDTRVPHFGCGPPAVWRSWEQDAEQRVRHEPTRRAPACMSIAVVCVKQNELGDTDMSARQTRSHAGFRCPPLAKLTSTRVSRSQTRL